MTILYRKVHYMKAGNLLPTLRGHLVGGNGQYQDLTGATVLFYMRDSNEAMVINGKTVDILDDLTGEVEYTWDLGETLIPGTYDGEMIATIGGLPISYPNKNNFKIQIRSSLAL
jgi:hypothetical protein